MKLKEEVEEILNKHDLEVVIPDEYETVYKWKMVDEDEVEKTFGYVGDIDDATLFEKYRKHIPKGWYGFSIGHPTPTNWFTAIDEVVAFCVKNDPDFEIHQIKMKFGGIRFYVESEVIEDIWDIIFLVENKLHSRKLIN